MIVDLFVVYLGLLGIFSDRFAAITDKSVVYLGLFVTNKPLPGNPNTLPETYNTLQGTLNLWPSVCDHCE